MSTQHDTALPDFQLGSLRDTFERDGFVIIRNLFREDEVNELRSQVDRYVRDVVPTLPKTAAFFDDYSKPETLRKMQSLDKHDDWFKGFMSEGKHVPLLEYFIRDGFVPQGLEWFNKLPYDKNFTPAHQDGFYWCRKPMIGCSLWIALDSVDESNACLYYARGSHKLGIMPHVSSNVLGFSQGLPDWDMKGPDAVACIMEPGDAIAHSAEVVHWSGVSTTDRSRRALATFCYGASTVRDEVAFARYKASLQAQLAAQDIDGKPVGT